MTYQPVTAVLTDGRGHFLEVVICDCDDGETYPWEPDYENCPVHSRVELHLGGVGSLSTSSAPDPLPSTERKSA